MGDQVEVPCKFLRFGYNELILSFEYGTVLLCPVPFSLTPLL